MKYIWPFIVIFILSTVPVANGQTATIWGPGEGYEIDYLHSGKYILDGNEKIAFEDEPSAEFTISNITNDGYDYVYLGYNSLSDMGSIVMQTINLGFTSVTLPSGGLPFVLPLAYGQQDDWLQSFSEQVDAFSSLGETFSQGLFNANSSTDDDYMYLEFEFSDNSSVSMNNEAFVDLPKLSIEEFEGKNVTYINSTFSGEISYKLSTGVLFELDFQFTSDEVLVDDVSKGTLTNSQYLEFVAIIPPASIIEDLNFDNVIFLSFLILIIPIRKVIRDLMKR